MDDTKQGARRDVQLRDELDNFQRIARLIKPSGGEVPVLDGVDLDAMTMPLIDSVGGDHLVWIDFQRRFDLDARIRRARAEGRTGVAAALELNRQRAGVLLADVSGHKITDGLVAAMLHQAFLLGTYYELDETGEITTKLLHYVQKRFYESTNIDKYFTMVYGEISSSGRFRFVSAGHPAPVVFSRAHRRRESLDATRLVAGTPVGFLPPRDDPDRPGDPFLGAPFGAAAVNELHLLGTGDVLLLFTDGLVEHAGGRFFENGLERSVVEAMDGSASEICAAIRRGIAEAGPREDDISVVVMKRR
jgi:serine phosphatase RsbU (regulator of sigma subunit)